MPWHVSMPSPKPFPVNSKRWPFFILLRCWVFLVSCGLDRVECYLHQVTFLLSHHYLYPFVLDSGPEWEIQPVVMPTYRNVFKISKPTVRKSLIVTLYICYVLHWVELRKKKDVVEGVLQTHDSTRKFTSLSNSWSISEKNLWTDLNE